MKYLLLAMLICLFLSSPPKLAGQSRQTLLAGPTSRANATTAQTQDGRHVFDRLAHELATKLIQAGYKKIIVMDFIGPDSYWSPFAAWLADELSTSFKNVGHPLRVVDRARLADYDDILEQCDFELQMLPDGQCRFGGMWESTAPSEAELRVARLLGADAVIDGTYAPAKNGVGVTLHVGHVAEPNSGGWALAMSIGVVSGKIAFTKEIGSQVYLPLDALWPESQYFITGEGGIGSPSCIWCPDVEYSAQAGAAKPEGMVLVISVISAEGRATRMKVVKGLGPGIDEQAMEWAKRWKLKPATDVDGRPVAVSILMELKPRSN